MANEDYSSGIRVARHKKKTKKKVRAGKVILILVIVLAILLMLFSGAALIMDHFLSKIDKADNSVIADGALDLEPEEEEDIPEDALVLNPDEVEWADIEALEDNGLVNILLVGQDSRTGARERSDSMILVSFNPETGETSLISFMRDLYVKMPEGYQDNRMNSAYAYGGFPYLYEVLQSNFGVSCAGGFEVNFDGFKNVIDTMGGVDIELSAAEARYIGNGCVEGMNHLDGTKALSYARIRKIDSDFNRTQRQRNVLQALFSKVKDSDLNALIKLLDTLLPMMKTDMEKTEIVGLLMKIAPMMSDMELEQYRIPMNGGYYDATIRGMMVLVPDLAKNQQYLRDECLPY